MTERRIPMLVQADDAGIDEADLSTGAIALPTPGRADLATETFPAVENEDGSFLRGLALAISIAVPFWSLLMLGIYLLF